MNAKPRTALVVSGGGAKGAFAVGAIEHLVNVKNVSFDMVVGTSTGSLIGPFVASNELALLRAQYLDLRIDQFFRKRNVLVSLFAFKSVFDASPFRAVLKQRFDAARADRILNSKIRTIIATVSLQSGKVTYFYAGGDGTKIGVPPEAANPVKIRDRAMLLRAIEASSNQPVFMPPVRIRTSPNQLLENAHQYVDGGVGEYAPIRVALENGAKHVYAIVLGPKEKPPKKENYTKAFKIFVRTFDLFQHNVGIMDVVIADQVAEARGAIIKYIRPKRDLPTGSLEADPAIQDRMIVLGRNAARDAGTIPTPIA
ncbi:MAG: patatin-like phospholipase family protein [Gemmatimonadota bacterium]